MKTVICQRKTKKNPKTTNRGCFWPLEVNWDCLTNAFESFDSFFLFFKNLLVSVMLCHVQDQNTTGL